MAWKYNDRVIRVGRSWQDDDGITHPTNWANWSDEEKAAAGLVWEADPAPYDARFYWAANIPKAIADVTDEDGNTTLGLKSVWKATIKQQAAGLLADTDWYVTRNAETGAAIPADVTTYRTAVRTASGTIEAAIDAAADHAAFVALFDVPLDAEGNATGNAPIADWPEENA